MVEVSVIIPTMNEGASIGAVLDEVRATLAGRDLEILTVDTDSRDRTNQIAAAKGARVISEPRRGYGRAYKTGFANAKGTYILTLDADRTYPANRFRDLLRPVEADQADFASADRLSRISEEAMTGMHRIGNAMLSRTFRVLYQYPIRDCQSGMWAFRRDLLPRLRLVHDGMAFSEEIKLEVIRRGFRFLEIPIDYRPRAGEKKIRSFQDAFANLVWLFRKRFGWVPAGP